MLTGPGPGSSCHCPSAPTQCRCPRSSTYGAPPGSSSWRTPVSVLKKVHLADNEWDSARLGLQTGLQQRGQVGRSVGSAAHRVSTGGRMSASFCTLSAAICVSPRAAELQKSAHRRRCNLGRRGFGLEGAMARRSRVTNSSRPINALSCVSAGCRAAPELEQALWRQTGLIRRTYCANITCVACSSL